ncbi:hypothetical protein [Tumebacillus flagellatus]|uniref:Uncharacterized protein n=1 Tax=Tumebacillus flagellatus TaxID=1157490 RepID=A0A074LI40_9BACL|nr:hypothetical protein [Tumebacillus flagellatus]KEO80814.1 hypothetical protein EL26_24280 [Tumebacillus flagellatus]
MNDFMKRCFLVLVCIFFVSILPLQAWSDVLVGIDKGTIYFSTTDHKASTGIRYVSTGWTIRRDRACVYPAKDPCNPDQGTYGMIHTGKMVEVGHTDSADGQYVTT